MKSKRRKIRRPLSATLMITPMIDMFTVILIFLVVSYSPEQSRILKSEEIELPREQVKLARLPQLQIEIGDAYLSINGDRINAPQTATEWKAFQARLEEFRANSREVSSLIIADKSTPYRLIDRAVSYLSASGYSEVYFLTQED